MAGESGEISDIFYAVCAAVLTFFLAGSPDVVHLLNFGCSIFIQWVAAVGIYCQDSQQVRPCMLGRDMAQASLSTGSPSHLLLVAHGPDSKYPPQLTASSLYHF